MRIVKIDNSFYAENIHLEEVLDKRGSSWQAKPRGYGIVLIQTKGLKFGIPLRSNIRHKSAFITKREDDRKKGLDFTKAILLTDEKYISSTFRIPNDEFVKLSSKEHFIVKKFTKYVNGYIKEVELGNDPTLKRKYQFSTLRNYHKELGLE